MEVLYNVAGGVILSLASSTVNAVGLRSGFTDELEKLIRTVSSVQAVILHAEEQSLHNGQVKHWLGLLGEALYDAEDLLDEISYEALREQVMGGSDFSKKVRIFFSSSNQLVFRRKMGHKVKALRERFDGIAAEKRNFHLEERCGAVRSLVPNDRYQTHSSPPQVVIGRDQDKEQVVELLHSSDCVENVSVVAIVGIGGLGKTTLAQMVYGDHRVESHFEVKIWVCVSDEFDVKLLVKKVIESATKKAPSCNEMEPLKDLLHGQIKGKRYLLVLDDVWNEDVSKWSSFIDLLTYGAKGSMILITTRSPSVAESSRATAVHELKGLPEEESWSLFKQVAFNQRYEQNPSREVFGKEIVKKCCGVPLAIKAIAGVLYSKDPDIEWGQLKDDELLKIDVFEKDIEPILRLSYNHLPSPYKHCFAYCCLFPKDFKIPVDKLIQLWEAQGYVKPTNENESVRDISWKYFKDLLRLSFFQDVEVVSLGNIVHCKMHDLMHDLALSVAGDDFSPSSDLQMTRFKNNSRHMSFRRYNKRHESSLLKMKNMRTILRLGEYEDHALKKSEADAIFCYLRRLRVLDLSMTKISALPNSIYEMKLLRYLDLSNNKYIKELPNSLASLHNLLGLKLERCSNLRKLPSDITKLVNLTDLDNHDCHALDGMPRGIGKLTKLKNLPEFVIAEDQSISKNRVGLDELHSLDNLRGELAIRKLRFVRNAASGFKEGLLSSKKNLQILTLDWGYERACDEGNEEMVMEALCPHSNLKALAVFNYRGVKPPSWLQSITNLVEVRIIRCSSIQSLPPLDQLLHLERLEMSNMSELESIEVKNGGGSSLFFPALTHLTLKHCPNLKGFERLSAEELPPFPCLSQLTIRECPNLSHLPLSPRLEKFDFDPHVKLASEFREDLLRSKQNLRKLMLEWGSYDAIDEGNEYMGMEELRPHPNLKKLVLRNYSGVNPPGWLPSITNLVEVSFYGCSSIQRLPPFDQLPLLNELEIDELTKLESIEVENGGGSSSFFPSLLILRIYDCPNLKGFSKEELPCFPCLSQLYILGCPNLIYLPLSPELEHLEWTGVKSLIEILKMPTNSAFTLSKLQLLIIRKMEDCVENELNDGMQWQTLESLRSLDFGAMENMVSLPEGLQYATTLQRLSIYKCPSLGCIPEWMTNLIALQHLFIRCSPKVEERCKNNSAEDWHKISHIPNIHIGGRKIQRNGRYLL